ncbi:MAG TPA: transglycosylase SLT domain-containing protein, partial [Acidimicrobiia bacterium]|nr:transglycosylase SLT domain-containing protein [Acidimicrobiia bacterium]
TFGTLAGLVGSGLAAGRVHTIRRGETLSAISHQYSVDLPTLVAANGLRNANLIIAGRTLVIPATPPPPPAAAAALEARVVPMPPAELAAARPAPRLVIPADRIALRPVFVRFARVAGVPADLAMALAWQESGWQRNRVSSTNAVGLMQLMPDTVDFVAGQLLGLKQPLDPRDPVANIRMGTRFLRYLLDSNDGDVDRALASYYQGLRSVRERGPLDETDRFVANVKALRARF